MRIFLIGNGPSLNDTPLDLLKDEETMAMNKIDLIYDKTEWRPTFYFRIDYNSLDKDWKESVLANLAVCRAGFLWDMFRDGYPKDHPNHNDLPDGIGYQPNVTWLPRCEKHHYYSGGNSNGMTKWHFPDICTGVGGMSAMLQLAVRLGYEEIYLLGCDLGFTDDITKNHFDPSYQFFDPRDVSKAQNKNNEWLHKVAKECSPVPIYNASVGGNLDTYPRVDIHEVLNA